MFKNYISLSYKETRTAATLREPDPVEGQPLLLLLHRVYAKITWPQANARRDLKVPPKEPLPQVVVLSHCVPTAAGTAHRGHILHVQGGRHLQEDGIGKENPWALVAQ